jgi:hypothetical protein
MNSASLVNQGGGAAAAAPAVDPTKNNLGRAIVQIKRGSYFPKRAIDLLASAVLGQRQEPQVDQRPRVFIEAIVSHIPLASFPIDPTTTVGDIMSRLRNSFKKNLGITSDYFSPNFIAHSENTDPTKFVLSKGITVHPPDFEALGNATLLSSLVEEDEEGNLIDLRLELREIPFTSEEEIFDHLLEVLEQENNSDDCIEQVLSIIRDFLGDPSVSFEQYARPLEFFSSIINHSLTKLDHFKMAFEAAKSVYNGESRERIHAIISEKIEQVALSIEDIEERNSFIRNIIDSLPPVHSIDTEENLQRMMV